MNAFTDVGGRLFLDNDLRSWIIAAAQFAVWFTVLPLLRAFITRRVKALTPEQSAAPLELVLALLKKTTRLFLVVVASWLALRWLTIPEQFDRWIMAALLLVLWLQVARWGTATVNYLIEQRRRRDEAATEGAASLNILRFVGVALVWVIAFLMLLANLGINITTLIAGLGIGGIAIALAVQNVLGDLLASLSIALDKPFKVGDFLTIGDEKGTVEHIGIKSTRLRSISGEQIVMSNSDLLSSRVRNFGLLFERRINFKIGIVYETPREKIERVPKILESVIRAQPRARFDRAHFAAFGDFSLNFEAVYFVLDPAYGTYMDTQQAINLSLLEEFQKAGIEFAYPTVVQYNAEMKKG